MNRHCLIQKQLTRLPGSTLEKCGAAFSRVLLAERPETDMIVSRAKGIAKLAIACQCIAVTLVFWLWLPLSQGKWQLWNLNVERYLVYNIVLIIGVAFAYATTTSEPWFTQRVFFVCHRQAFRQTAFASGSFFSCSLANGIRTSQGCFCSRFCRFFMESFWPRSDYSPRFCIGPALEASGCSASCSPAVIEMP